MTNKIKTGTTCVGVLFKDGVLLAADRRATGGIMTEKLQKVFSVTNNMLMTIAGNAADCQLYVRYIKGELKLLELKNERPARVKEAAMILNSMQYSGIRTQGVIAALILGGYDSKEGFTLHDLYPDGTMLPNPGYVVSGSGSVFIKGLFDNEFTNNMSQKDALDLVDKAFRTSFKNDPASGGGYIARIVTKDGIEEIERKVTKTEIINE